MTLPFRLFRAFWSLPVLAAALLGAAPAQAQGDLLVAPTRIVINGAGSAEVVLNNIGDQPATYRIGLELRRMTADGALEAVDAASITPEQKAVLDMFRYSPRRITLPPNQPQSVRISARPPEGLADGEYRVQMSFRAIPEARPVEEAGAGDSATGFTIKLTPIYGVSIPLILRKGQATAVASLAHAAVVREGEAARLTVDLERQGNRSIYGEVRVVAAGVKEPLFLVRGIAVYTEVTKRRLEFPLTAEQAARLKGPVTVEYREMPENGGRLLASLPVKL